MTRKVVIWLILVVLLTSCSFGKSVSPTVDPAIAALESTLAVQNAAATIVALSAAQTQAALPPVAIPTEAPPTAEPTATEVPAVRVTALQNANCRLGPYANFDLVETIQQGASADVIGQNAVNGQWWKVKLTSGKECWVLGTLVSVEGDTSKVAQEVSPNTPTPKPAPTWDGAWTLWISGSFDNKAGSVDQISVNMVQKGDQVTYSFKNWGISFTAYLTSTADGLRATGSLVRADGQSWALILVRTNDNLNQFKGVWYTGDRSWDGENCGARSGYSKPSPCRP